MLQNGTYMEVIVGWRDGGGWWTLTYNVSFAAVKTAILNDKQGAIYSSMYRGNIYSSLIWEGNKSVTQALYQIVFYEVETWQ